ncbi:PAP2 superfamily protein [Rubripirellula tenax]|uniref:PAP2 superfamily protein n=1 Tax=Rubripirellula tenax TaxID=2528015 RepID=A0A5C6FFY4_9BACT|nr:phosphatase PAP2 family protein [Rubripirellula tenax]TWU60338.1 PAP2 superfamily protein [Rubripirellula tenax]
MNDLNISGRGSRSHYSVFGSFQLLTLLWVSVVAMLMVPLMTLVDVPIADWIHRNPMPQWIETILGYTVLYSQPLGVVVTLTLVLALSRKRRRCVPRLATLAIGAGLLANLIKVFVLRPRPGDLQFEAINHEYAWIWTFDWTLAHIASFDPGTRAFPSASLATAMALTAGLWVLAPSTRKYAVILCVGTLLQRALCGAHFASDLCGSASLGLAWAYICLHPRLMGTIFDRFEPDRELLQRKVRLATNEASDPIDVEEHRRAA